MKHQLWPLDRKIRVIEQVAKESRELEIANKTWIQGKVVLWTRKSIFQAKLFVRRQEAEMEVWDHFWPPIKQSFVASVISDHQTPGFGQKFDYVNFTGGAKERQNFFVLRTTRTTAGYAVWWTGVQVTNFLPVLNRTVWTFQNLNQIQVIKRLLLEVDPRQCRLSDPLGRQAEEDRVAIWKVDNLFLMKSQWSCSVVSSYFIFLRWVFYINFLIAGVILGLIILPELFSGHWKESGVFTIISFLFVIVIYRQIIANCKIIFCCLQYRSFVFDCQNNTRNQPLVQVRKEMLSIEKRTSTNIKVLWDFEGILRSTM